MHPVGEIRGEKSSKLKDKRIVLCITGSIAAVESFYLCRELIRHGADVIPVMSDAATRIIHPDTLAFASGHPPVLSLTGGVEHVTFCGNTRDKADLVLVHPCTANTLSKIALGLCDNAVTACVITAEGAGIPIMVVPAMHLAMYKNPAVAEHLGLLKKRGFYVIEPRVTETKAKIAEREEIVAHMLRLLRKQDLTGRRILIIGGASAEAVDEIRVLTNRSTGKMAAALAKTAFERGAEVELWLGWSKEKTPVYIKVKRFESVNDLLKMIKDGDIKRFDTFIVCAALANYLPKKHKGKIPSGKKSLTIEFEEASSVVAAIKQRNPDTMVVAFKAEEKKNTLLEKAASFLKHNEVDILVANTLSCFGADESEIWIINGKQRIHHVKGKKEELAESILSTIIMEGKP
ncbi:MAG TPA: bifunctional phosphopantothenoylcysteine decarboxylase/phosphopantothenate--cysteine ligase CoaBC [Thermoplasmata archaeon]|nr:bifunctional phosphopantothenoylcysteine decarboxylase/phosphopantothenate--cysteine ligase CoaBC [Thermoplasmata archaeon]